MIRIESNVVSTPGRLQARRHILCIRRKLIQVFYKEHSIAGSKSCRSSDNQLRLIEHVLPAVEDKEATLYCTIAYHKTHYSGFLELSLNERCYIYFIVLCLVVD